MIMSVTALAANNNCVPEYFRRGLYVSVDFAPGTVTQGEDRVSILMDTIKGGYCDPPFIISGNYGFQDVLCENDVPVENCCLLPLEL